jgi:lipoprotein NlpD
LRASAHRLSIGVLWVLIALLSGCGGRAIYAPVEERAAAPSRRIEHHIVAPGETLYSIAWRYGMDFRRLGSTNNIGLPYRLHPGQRLVLREAPTVPGQNRSGAGVADRSVRSRAGGAGGDDAAATTVRRGGTVGAGAVAGLSAPWRWPANGSILRHFRRSPPEHKGIDIRGELGEPVYAANSGTVVYAGHGLVGYGNLLIIRHSDRYLSAYAHNSALLVAEGQAVKVGERIAEIGDSGTDSMRLHFEVRRDGRPVDPLELLPQR